jgi:hypothetical protein
MMSTNQPAPGLSSPFNGIRHSINISGGWSIKSKQTCKSKGQPSRDL